MGHFRCHADALARSGMRMNGLANVHRVRAHLDGQRNLGDLVDTRLGL